MIVHYARRREAAQTLVLAAFALVALLAFVGLVLNMGLFLAQRRHLQNAADAMALAASWRVLDEQTSLVYLDSAVLSQTALMATRNQVAIPGDATLGASYVDQSGSILGSVGSGTMPPGSAGVRIRLAGQFQTMLAPFVGQNGVQIGADSEARLVPVVSVMSRSTAVPLTVPAAAYLAAGSGAYDLYSLASPFLDLTTVSGGTVAPNYGDLHTNLQYWSDGSHAVGTLSIGSTVTLAGTGFAPDVQTGLLDNSRRQNLPNDPLYVGLGVAPYVLVDVPLCQPCSSPSVTISGFARFHLAKSQISSSHLVGSFVPYVDDPVNSQRRNGPLQGPVMVVLTR